MTETTAYFLMFEKPPTCEITNIIKFPENDNEEVNIRHYYIWIEEKANTQVNKYQ